MTAIVAALGLSACGAAGLSSTTGTSSTSSTSTTSSTSSTTTTTLPPAAAENLFISRATIALLQRAFDVYKAIPARDIAGVFVDGVYYGYVPSTRTYWARASFEPAQDVPLAVAVSMQDGGNDAIFSLPPGGSWHVVGLVGVPFCEGLQHDPVPASILAVWQLCQPAGSTPAPARCPTSWLTVRVGQGAGAAGTDLFPLVFTNRGAKSCLLQGFPGVSFQGATGFQVAQPAVRAGSSDGPTITVEPGASAIANAVESEGAVTSCSHPLHVVGFRVYPPNQYTSLLAPFPQPVCAGAPARALVIYPFGVARPQL